MKTLAILQNSVTIGSLQHLIPIVVAGVLAITIIRYANRQSDSLKKEQVIHFLGCLISAVVICYHFYKIIINDYNFKTDLPLYLCSFLAVIIPVFTYYRKHWMFEILVFWIIGGTLQGAVTPDVSQGFPAFDYFRYWTVHLGLLIVIFYFIFVFKMKPKFKSVFKSFFALQVYVVIMVFLNYVLDANYFYLNQKPKSASLLDYFGDWPYYILVAQLIIIPLFLMIYLPFWLNEKKFKLLSK